ncbi:MAG: CBS domain-containing protein [Cellvibrionaceae bacterium]
MFVEDIMSVNLKTICPDYTLAEIRNIFDNESYHHLPVTVEGKIVGIISDRDLHRNTSPDYGTDQEGERDRELMNQTAADIMTSDIITVDKNSTIDTASILMLENTISCIPIIDDDNNLEGLLTWKDILQFYVYAGS